VSGASGSRSLSRLPPGGGGVVDDRGCGEKEGARLTAIIAGLLGVLFVVNGLGHFIRRPSTQLGPKLGIQDPLKPPPK
jgi:hypothetical protein